MPKLTIDGKAVEVPEGTNVLEAARSVGVVIPHFCYHPALGSVGACRLCAMKFIEGPVKGVQMSCMIKAADGMVVSTNDGDAARLRRMVIEWLMINHPHDCPVCDEGGMCLLQDYTISGGHSRRRYTGKKRTFPDQYLGEYIQQEMNRCIQCYRCSRFYQDYAGGDDFGPLQISNKTYFGRSTGGWLESEFAGNLADVCPTGVLTDKTFRYKARPWDLETSPSVCPNCSLGCNIIPAGRYRALLKVTARENPQVNGWFICDRGRFGYGYANREDRPRYAFVDGKKADFDKAVENAAARILETVRVHGPQSVAFAGSGRSSVENNYALKMFAQTVGSESICFSANPAREANDRLAASRLAPELRRSLKAVEDSDLIICVGADPVNEAPMLGLLMRQGVRKGARVITIDPRPVKLPFAHEHMPTAQESLKETLRRVVEKEAASSKTLTIVCGTDIASPDDITSAAEIAKSLKSSGKDAGLVYTMDEANSFGTALISTGKGFDDILEGIESGAVRLLVVMESDPLERYPDKDRLDKAINKLDWLFVMDCLATGTALKADILMPTTMFAEDDGVFVNNEGRAQAFGRAYISGIPVNDMGPALHPPRVPSSTVPGRTMPAWWWCSEVAHIINPAFGLPDGAAELRSSLAGEPGFEMLKDMHPEGMGAQMPCPQAPKIKLTPAVSGKGLRFIAVELTFGTQELSRFSDKTMLRSPEPFILVHPADAESLGLAPGSTVAAYADGYIVTGTLTTSEQAARGVAIAPRLAGMGSEALAGKLVELRSVHE